MSDVFDPYRRWLGIPQAEQPPHHYRLLGIGLFEDDPDVIEEAADRQMSHVQTHKAGKYSALSQKLLNELAAAKLCLLDKRQKAVYDQELRDRLPPAQAETAANASAADASPAKLLARSWRQPALLAIAAAVLAILLTGALLLRRPGDVDVEIAAGAVAPDERDAPTPKLQEAAAPEVDKRQPPQKETSSFDEAKTTENMSPERVVAPAQVDSASPTTSPAPPAERQVKPPAHESASLETKTKAPDERVEKKAKASPGEPKPPPPITREPVPEDAALKSAAQAIREQTANLRAETQGAAGKLELARRLMDEAQQPDLNSPSRYVLLREACDAAAEAGDYAEAATAIRRMAARFEVKPTALKSEALARVNQALTSPRQKAAVVDAALDLTAEAAEADDYPTADRVAQLAASAARTLKDRDRNEQARIRSKELAELSREFETLGDERATLQRDAADPQANLAIGSFQCLYKCDWQQGLKRWARGSDATLKRLAQQDLAAPSDASSRQKLAAAWRALAAESSGAAKTGFQLRAAYWLRLAHDDLKGTDRAKVGRQLAELKADPDFANRPRRWLEGRVNGFRHADEVDCANEQHSFELPDSFNPSSPWKLALEFKCASAKAAGPLLQIGGDQRSRAPVCVGIDDADKLYVALVDLDDKSKKYSLNYQMDAARRLDWRHIDVEYLPADHSIVVELDQRRVAAAICPYEPDLRRPVTIQIGAAANGPRFAGRVRRVSFQNQ